MAFSRLKACHSQEVAVNKTHGMQESSQFLLWQACFKAGLCKHLGGGGGQNYTAFLKRLQVFCTNGSWTEEMASAPRSKTDPKVKGNKQEKVSKNVGGTLNSTQPSSALYREDGGENSVSSVVTAHHYLQNRKCTRLLKAVHKQWHANLSKSLFCTLRLHGRAALIVEKVLDK